MRNTIVLSRLSWEMAVKTFLCTIAAMSLCWIFLLSFSLSGFAAEILEPTDCPELRLSDLGSTVSFTKRGLLARALEHDKTVSSAYKILHYNLVCLSQGSRQDTYSMVSVIVSYMVGGQNKVEKEQLHFQCINDAWSIHVFAKSLLSRSSSSIKGNFRTPLRRDCWACVDLNHPGVLVRSEDEHCLSCPGECSGLHRCLLNRTCCNVFDINGDCALACPEYSTPDKEFRCQCDRGFMKDNGTCVLIKTCDFNPCENDGRCVEGDKLNTCTCLDDFKGPVCESCNSISCKDCAYNETANDTDCYDCQEGYFLSATECVSCGVADCKFCASKGVCSECLQFFSWENGSCFEVSAQEVESRTGRNPEAIFYPMFGGALVILLGIILQYTCQSRSPAHKIN